MAYYRYDDTVSRPERSPRREIDTETLRPHSPLRQDDRVSSGGLEVLATSGTWDGAPEFGTSTSLHRMPGVGEKELDVSCGIGHFARRAAPCWCSRWIDPSPAALDDAAAHTPPNCMMFRVCRVGGCLSLLSAPLSISILARLASVAHGHTKVYNVFDQHGTLSIDTGCFYGDRCRDCIASLRNGRAFDDCGVVATAHALALADELGCHGLDRARLRPAGVPSVQP